MKQQEKSEKTAELILEGFKNYRQQFREITLGAGDRFERADWSAVQSASTARIQLYRSGINEILESLDESADCRGIGLEDWKEVKAHFTAMIREQRDADLAETVFNTIFRKRHGGKYLTDEYAFVTESFYNPIQHAREINPVLTRNYGYSTDLKTMLRRIFADFEFKVPYLDLEADINLIVMTMKRSIPLLRRQQDVRFELLKSVFYRNKGAYIIGRMFIGQHLFPIAIPVHNDGEGLYVDTIIWNESDLSIIFSFTRSYFMVDIDYPYEMVKYLLELLPNKKPWELYTAVGFYKHGKTEFYRGFVNHLEESNDSFIVAEGIKGLVMSVFTLPSYQVVFKIIKDKFSPTKNVTRRQVKDAYYLVKTHDRVGRMADTQEFINFVFPRNRFSEELIDELSSVAASSVTITDEHVTISHLYTERLMIPLNIYIKDKSDFELSMALDEYGNAIKQLAAANIFPGDMLLKNFGVTRHGRVVFYDYDEICYLTEINFREIPPPRYPEDELAAEPWYSVSPNDVFPEEIRTFLFNSKKLEEIFCENHEDLFTVAYWKELQENIRDKQVMDVYPYRRKRRFERNN